MPVTISAAVEGVTDEAVARVLIQHAGGIPGAVYGKSGKQHLREKIAGYNNAARHGPWFVLVDLDQEADCAPPVRMDWVAAPAPLLCFRVAVRAVEAWLLADGEALAGFLGVSKRIIPADPDDLPAPKEMLVNLARRSRRKAIREDMVPREGSGRSVGPAYPSRLIEFVTAHWRPATASRYSESLERAVACLRTLAGTA